MKFSGELSLENNGGSSPLIMGVERTRSIPRARQASGLDRSNAAIRNHLPQTQSDPAQRRVDMTCR